MTFDVMFRSDKMEIMDQSLFMTFKLLNFLIRLKSKKNCSIRGYFTIYKLKF